MRVRTAVILLALCLPAQAQDGLRYRMQLWLRDEAQPLETRFRLVATAGTVSHNRVKRPRMGGWRLEADRGQGTPYSQALLLGRAEQLLYLAGPSPQTHAEPLALRFGTRSLPVWSLSLPRGLNVSTALVEIGPRLLALCDLSARFEHGEVARVELHLEGLDATGDLAPAERGTVLLRTLQAWAAEAQQGHEDSGTVR